MKPDRIRENLETVRDRMAEAARRSGRSPSEVRLVAVTKRNPADRVRRLVEAGATDLGENYPQELWGKAEALADLPIRWHLIGHLQGNKAKRTVPMVRMIHGVDSLKLLGTLDELSAGLEDPPALCLQVNASFEESKHGWEPDAILADAQSIAGLRHAQVVGLMTMAGYGTTDEEARPTFAALRELRERLRIASGLELPELSMGMSGDFNAAIEEGATLVRIGSALFEGVE
ncbi:YggS family pyridoxal phosphate-dependent enzyme [Tundrisphaera lichenicola]|uniref:YggS family pyridoxal phosphate-dependent enzyme n=1 Tax=Tundrisphaera lichenicola TaxID=2029860 RepID=UPI003EBE01D4